MGDANDEGTHGCLQSNWKADGLSAIYRNQQALQ